MQTTVQVRLYPTPEQAALLRAPCREYIGTVNVQASALDSGVLPDGGTGGASAPRTSPPRCPAAQRRQESGAARRARRLEAAVG